MWSRVPGVVHDAERVVEHPLPHLRRDDGRDRPRNEHHGAHDAAALEARVDDEGDDQPERELEADRDQRELDRRPDRVAEDRVVPELAVVLEADPLRRLEREELLVGEALVDGLAERVDRDERDDRERGHEQQPGEARLPALELRRPAAAAWAGCGSGDGGHRRRRGRMADAILPRFGSGSRYLTSRSSLDWIDGSTLLAGVPLRIWLIPW